MTVLLFTTTDVRGPRGGDLERLFASVDASARRGLAVQHRVLLQNCAPAECERRRAAAPAHRRFEAVPQRLSLSAARNRMIAAVLAENPPHDDAVVGFPDDDCWMPPRFLERLSAVFAARARLDLLICRVGLDPDGDPFDGRSVIPADASAIVRVSSSNNMFLRGALLRPLRGFDPTLGLGTRAGGGEDTDFVIRAFLRSREAGFVDRALVGHPAPDRDSAAKYFRGAFTVLARHARSRPGLALECARKLLVGLYFIGRGKLSPGTYRAALGEGLRAARTEQALPN